MQPDVSWPTEQDRAIAAICPGFAQPQPQHVITKSTPTKSIARQAGENAAGLAIPLPIAIDAYSFLVGRLVDAETLAQAIAMAERCRVAPHAVLLADGFLIPQDYVSALAQHIGAQTVEETGTVPPSIVLLDAVSLLPSEVMSRAGGLRRKGIGVALVTPAYLASRESAAVREERLAAAIKGLARRDPELSATGPIWLWQTLTLAIAIGMLAGAASIAPNATRGLLMACITVPFFFIVVFRLGAFLVMTVQPRQIRDRRPTDRTPDGDLPVYSVLVPLFRETAVLPDLVAALSALDYPAAKLDCILVLEASDQETLAIASAMKLPPFMRVVVVPDRTPRTKPKALNYAMHMARGSFVVVYDAEDVPDPQQLRAALAVFSKHGPRFVCVQARLAIHNAKASWLTRQFALEYAALFEGLLPALAAFNLPTPLGGTSNHFRRPFLEKIGGWDPHNVTEDADLGIRIARAGGRIAMVDSTTWEEAPERLRPWIGQRSRWLKGWMQTYLVHMRRPVRLWSDLGAMNFLAFQALMGGVLLSSLFHPLFYGLLAWEIWHGDVFAAGATYVESGLALMAGFNMLAGYASAMLLAALAVMRTRRASLAPHVLLMPCYWLLVSWAALRGMVQLVTAPFYWEKTTHAARRKG